jgi:hypothetical protein
VGQSTEYPAIAALYLDQQKTENGQAIYSNAGKFWELERNIAACSEYVFGSSTDQSVTSFSDEQRSRVAETLKTVI